jgi:hypothetical protein
MIQPLPWSTGEECVCLCMLLCLIPCWTMYVLLNNVCYIDAQNGW